MDEARAAFARLMSNYPDLTIARVKQAMVFSQSYIDRMCDNLRKLGLPD
jgi:uncharacterized protein (DUF433 family)